ncbi:MAG: DUF1320 family protein [Rhodothermia bacterium]|nr:DUF1320 family protein [Rhodothermia bacterium]
MYCTTGDIIETYTTAAIAELTGDATGQLVDENRLQRALDYAGAVVDAAVRVHYPNTDFVTTPNLFLKQLQEREAFLTLHEWQARFLGEEMLSIRKLQNAQLEALRRGEIGLASGNMVIEISVPEPRHRERVFGAHRAVLGAI